MILNELLKQTIKRIALVKMGQAETYIGSGNGDIKLEYVVNLIIEELKKLPLPIYIKAVLVVCQFAVKPELRLEVQKVFNEAKDEVNKARTMIIGPVAMIDESRLNSI